MQRWLDTIAQGQLRDYESRLGATFEHEAYLSELTALRDGLKASLSGTTPEPATESAASVSELAERIKALRAARVIESAPQRAETRHFTAEEPITAQIRRMDSFDGWSRLNKKQDSAKRLGLR